METRVLIPNGLRIVITDTGLKSSHTTIESPNYDEEDTEEKPSSSSGHCETGDDHPENLIKIEPQESKTSSCEDEEGSKSWQKEYRDQLTSNSTSSSSSSLSPTCSETSSENEAELGYSVKRREKSDSLIGSTSTSFEFKKSSRKQGMENNKEKLRRSQVKICATRVIEKGTVFTPNDGEVQVVSLPEIPAIPKDDIRFIFGCFETVTPISISPPPPSSSGSDSLISPASTTTTTATSPQLPDEKGCYKFLRLCNWIRFLRQSGSFRNNPGSKQLLQVDSDSDVQEDEVDDNRKSNTNIIPKRKVYQRKNSSDSSDCLNFTNDSSKICVLTSAAATTAKEGENSNNIVARFVDGRPIFEVMERLVPGTELVAEFDTNSILSNAPPSAAAFPYMSSPPTMTAVASTPFPPLSASSLPPPPAPYSPSTRISSSSPGLLKSFGNAVTSSAAGGGVKKDRDEQDLLQQHYLRQLPAFHYSFQHDYSGLGKNASQNGNLIPPWKGGGSNDVRFSKQGDDRRKHHSLKTHGSVVEGPLDLSKFPVFKKSHQPYFTEPLKVGTPFDSPDSNNDDEMVKNVPSPLAASESRGSSVFSIRNVLKHQTSGTPSKLFQPYSLDGGQKSVDREALMKVLASQQGSGTTASSLVTPPSGSDDHLAARNSSGLRPILRTRGRERSLLPCEVCGKAFDRPSLLKRHLRTHTGEKPHVCDVCSKGFSTSSSLNTHRRIHSGEKPHQCPICGKRFTASSNLYYHRMTHNKEKPHKCMLCGKSFPTPGDLKSHQYVHSGSWPYTCPVCHRGFSKQTNLRNHLLLHSGMASNSSSNKSGDKPHTCPVCDKKFAQACNLRAHVKTHEESDPVTSNCSICKRSFLSPSDLLVNGRCRNCLLNLPSTKAIGVYQKTKSTSSSPTGTPCLSKAATAGDKAKEGFTSTYDVPSLLSHRIASSMENTNQQHASPSVGHLGLPLSQFPGLSIPGLSSALSFPTNASNVHFPMSGNISGSNAADLFVNSAGTTPPMRSGLFEQLVEWNYRIAKESVGIGSLGFSIMQQKLLESRMLAAQLMNSHSFGINGGMQDILGLRSAITTEGFSSLEPALQGENKFMPR